MSSSPPSLAQRDDTLETANGSDDLDSLPSSRDSDSDGSDMSDAEREWKESLQQLELLLTMVVVPYVGKYFGRKFAYWGWARFMEWRYPVQVVITNKKAFKGAGMVEVAAAL
ncbi:MAG: hypothetical protein M1833_005109 [Piccolia ochrophora]|nr:MAG: hypothetical protein M1833_005109 [Piccolia ochrophora]